MTVEENQRFRKERRDKAERVSMQWNKTGDNQSECTVNAKIVIEGKKKGGGTKRE